MTASNKYLISPELQEAVLAAEITGRPLLIKGEPGTGKTMLAYALASKTNRQFFKWSIKSTTLAKDGLYFYDAVSRLYDARFSELTGKDRVNNVENYIRLGPLGECFASTNPCLLLIDEIDKADIEFPNDLLQELDLMEFTITETGKTIKAKDRPLVIITSNNEKELPDAFLRRCLFHYIEFPKPHLMQEILQLHFPDLSTSIIPQVLEAFYPLREMDLKKRPSTSELIDWLRILLHQGASLEKVSSLPHLYALIKDEEDLIRLKSKKR